MDMSNHPASAIKPQRPASAVSSGVGVAGLAGMFSWIAIARYAPEIAVFFGVDWQGRGPMDGPYSALVNVAACGLPMLLWSLLIDEVHLRPSTGIDWNAPKRISETLDFSLTKLCGLWATWGIIGLLYYLCRWYWQGTFLFSMEMFQVAAPALFVLSIPYVIWLDRFLIEPRDGAWHLGSWLMSQPGWDDQEIAHHARAWAVKGFFLAFMIGIVPGGFGEVVRTPLADIVRNPVTIAQWLISLMFVIDVGFATVGYLLTMKPLDAHIRTANPHMQGWVAALICYPPFVMMGDNGPLNYHHATRDWVFWMEGQPLLLALTGGILVLLTAIYAWATVAFGLRFSNLTHRGILTHGPYAWTKHPAYLSKNLFWWLSTLPFLVTTDSVSDAVRNTATIAAVSAVYFWRARTEEKHLRTDPAYQAYADWMDAYGPVPLVINWVLGKKRQVVTAS
jgi:protein-S-isoprenylcysteine O-methyltransferase Ste14